MVITKFKLLLLEILFRLEVVGAEMDGVNGFDYPISFISILAFIFYQYHKKAILTTKISIGRHIYSKKVLKKIFTLRLFDWS